MHNTRNHTHTLSHCLGLRTSRADRQRASVERRRGSRRFFRELSPVGGGVGDDDVWISDVKDQPQIQNLGAPSGITRLRFDALGEPTLPNGL